MLTLVPSQANHSSHGHAERLKHDPRHALQRKNGKFVRRNPEFVVDYVMPEISVVLVHTHHHAWHLEAQREVHRHEQNPLSLSTKHLTTFSLAVFARINGQKECGLITLS